MADPNVTDRPTPPPPAPSRKPSPRSSSSMLSAKEERPGRIVVTCGKCGRTTTQLHYPNSPTSETVAQGLDAVKWTSDGGCDLCVYDASQKVADLGSITRAEHKNGDEGTTKRLLGLVPPEIHEDGLYYYAEEKGPGVVRPRGPLPPV